MKSPDTKLKAALQSESQWNPALPTEHGPFNRLSPAKDKKRGAGHADALNREAKSLVPT